MKPKIEEIIVVEGRDDTAAIKRAVDATTIETHGFGMSKEMWQVMENANATKGLIVFTDPDHGGRSIRKKIMERFPEAKEAFLTPEKAGKKGDVGIENAAPEDIIEALKKSLRKQTKDFRPYEMAVLINYGLIGGKTSRQRRMLFCDKLGIGYSNGKALLNKLNGYEIPIEEFERVIREI
ncbi:MAG: ribonuclease M5 [Clostridiales bacterium]|nr:ribonuclease M5 [Clostridiales bacterium]MDY4060204.1 ribonuclease M5 [Anaerovoracaceae bacterium]